MIGVMTIQRTKVDIWTPPEKLVGFWEPIDITEIPGGDESWTWGGYVPPDCINTARQGFACVTWSSPEGGGCSVSWDGCAPR